MKELANEVHDVERDSKPNPEVKPELELFNELSHGALLKMFPRLAPLDATNNIGANTILSGYSPV